MSEERTLRDLIGGRPAAGGPKEKGGPGRRQDKRGCRSCKEKMLRKMQGSGNRDQDSAKTLQAVTAPSPLTSDPRLRLGAVITARNEPDVGETARSLVESVVGARHAVPAGTPRAEVVPFVVDDGSTDGSCGALAVQPPLGVLVRLIRHDAAQGVGRSRNAGSAAALAAGCDVVSFHDAHMRFPEGVMAALAAKALESGAIVTSMSRGWFDPPGASPLTPVEKPVGYKHHGFRAWGADMHWNLKDGLQPKYRIYCKDRPEWARVPCPMGACYVMSRETIQKLTAPTGRLWDDVAGLWGFSEQALAVKAFLLGIPVLVSRDLATHHHYRKVNPVPGASAEKWKNCAFSMAALLSEHTFDLRFRPYCEKHLGAKETERLVKLARKDHTFRLMPSAEIRIFTQLCGRGAKITELHEDHAWLSDLSAACQAVPQEKSLRLLQWRPGESTLLLRALCPGAEIVCLEWDAHRVRNWGPILKRMERVRFSRLDLDRWADPVGAGVVGAGERFDLITIGGELADECRAAAGRLLAPGGRIVANPTADRYQIEDADRRDAEEKLEVYRQRSGVRALQAPVEPDQGSGADAEETKIVDLPAAAPLPSVTVVLLNWQRPENIGPILDCLSKQTARPRVYIWDNGDRPLVSGDPQTGRPIAEHPLVDMYVKADPNMGCFPRWWLAERADTEFICTLDDDLLLADDRVIEDAMRAQRELCPDGIVGFFGWESVPGKPYKAARHINGSDRDRRCDLVKGRFMCLQKRLIGRVRRADPVLPEPLLRRCDDIFVSLSISAGRRGAHLVPGVLRKRFLKAGREDGRSLSLEPGHFDKREEAVRRLMAHFTGDKGKGA